MFILEELSDRFQNLRLDLIITKKICLYIYNWAQVSTLLLNRERDVVSLLFTRGATDAPKTFLVELFLVRIQYYRPVFVVAFGDRVRYNVYLQIIIIIINVRCFCRGSDRVQSHQRRTKGQARTSRPVFNVGRGLPEFGWRGQFVLAAASAAAATATAAPVVGAASTVAHPQARVRHDRDGRRECRNRYPDAATLAPRLVHVQPVADEFRGLAAAPGPAADAHVVVDPVAATCAPRHAAACARQGQEPEEEQEQVAGKD